MISKVDFRPFWLRLPGLTTIRMREFFDLTFLIQVFSAFDWLSSVFCSKVMA